MSNIKLKEILAIVILAVFSLFLGGYREATWHLPIIHKLSDPSLFPNDLMSTFLSSGGNNTSFFYEILAFISKYADLYIVSFIGFIITLIFFCLGIFYLAKFIFRNNWVAYLSVILLLTPKPGFSANTFSFEFVYRDIAIDLVLFSILFFLKKRYILSFILLGIAFDFHILSALPILGFFIFDLIFKYRTLDLTEKKRLYISLISFVLIILPLMIFYSSSPNSLLSTSIFSRADPQWLAIMQARAGNLITPFSADIQQYLWFTPLFILIVISGVYFFWNKKYVANIGVHKTILNLLIVFFIYIIIEVIFTEIIPWQPVMVLRLLTASSFILTMGIIYISFLIYELYQDALNEKMINRIVTYLLISVLFVLIFAYDDFRFAFIVIPLAITKLTPQISRKICYPLYFISFAIFIYLLFNELYLHTLLFSFCCLIALLGIDYIKQRNILPQMSRESLLGIILVAFIVFYLAGAIGSYSLNTGKPISETIVTRVNIPYLTPTSYYKDIQLWANKNTNISDIFLVPPEAYPGNESYKIYGGFRTYSKRPIYSEWQRDGDWGYFNHELASEWYRRMNDLGIYNPEDLEKYNLLDESEIRKLQEKYDISYAVFEKPKHLDFEIVYENELFVVFRIR